MVHTEVGGAALNHYETNRENWYTLGASEVIGALKSDSSSGLPAAEAARRLARHGENRLTEAKKKSPLRLLLQQFENTMVLVLLGATAISFFLGHVVDALAIVAIIILNGLLGFVQEYRAEKSLDALKRLSAPTSRVIRDGEPRTIPARELVPGDLLLLESGDRVPADGRLIEASGLEAEESALTGESLPVRKSPEVLSGEHLPTGDRRNLIFAGTTVTRGRGTAVVTATGMGTEMGRIAGLIEEAEEGETPLQKRLDHLGRWIVVVCLAVCGVVVGLGIMRDELILDMFLAGVSLAVAAIPEGLAAVVTVALALGVQRMARGRAIIRRLPAVETLGCATVICSDKTGTLTKNEMTVRQVYLGGRLLNVSGEGYRPFGSFTTAVPAAAGGREITPASDPDLTRLLSAAVLSSNARLVRGKRGDWEISGDPSEGALVVAAQKGGFTPQGLDREYRRVGELPFESERLRMTVIYRRAGADQLGSASGQEWTAFSKGAPDVILGLCASEWREGKLRPLTEERRHEILEKNQEMAGRALRVLAVAFRHLPTFSHQDGPDKVETELTFCGLMGMIDPPRPEAIRAIEKCKQAGLMTVMITGDHLATARAIARELGLLPEGSRSLTGADLERLTDDELREIAPNVTVYARVSPEHKLRIVRALKRNGHVAAMTGDGVNDAPALKEADIGVAMGKTGTDVTKEASSMILADDNFATIVRAVEEGRGIYDNIRKFIRFLLSCNIGEVLTMLLASLAGLPLPLLPIQILWVNLATDSLPAMALGIDPPDPDVMRRPPRAPNESVFSRGLGLRIAYVGTVIGLVTVAVFAYELLLGSGLERARTLAFAALVICQLVHAFDCRSERRMILETNLFGNLYLVAAVAVSTIMLLAVLYVPGLQVVFRTVSMTAADWLVVGAGVGAGGLLVTVPRMIRRPS